MSGFFGALEHWWLKESLPWAPGAPPPFAGGWTLFISYEMASEIERRLVLPRSTLPYRAFALRTPCAVIHDLQANRVYAVAEPEAAGSLDRIAADARRIGRQRGSGSPQAGGTRACRRRWSKKSRRCTSIG